MNEELRANDTERAIFDETFTALTLVDEQYRRDSELSLSQRDFHKDNIATSQAELERLEKIAEMRDQELTAHRRKIAAAALRIYAEYPDISEDRRRVFTLAGQLNFGQSLEEHELNALAHGLMSLDTAVSECQPIMRTVNGQFDSLLIPQIDATGLHPVTRKNYHNEQETVRLTIPTEKLIFFPYRSQFPNIRTDTRHDVLEEFMSYKQDERGHRQHHAPARVASSYDIKYGLASPETESENSQQVFYFIGDGSIQDVITNSGKKQGFNGPNTDLSFRTWLAANAAGHELTCNFSDVGDVILDATCDILVDSVSGYRKSNTESIDSDTAKILLSAINESGNKEQLFERFSSRLSERYDSHTIYGDRDTVRLLFEAVMKMSNQTSH